MEEKRRRKIGGVMYFVLLALALTVLAVCSFHLFRQSRKTPGQLFQIDRAALVSYSVTEEVGGKTREFTKAGELDNLAECLNGYRYSYVCRLHETGDEIPYRLTIRFQDGTQEEYTFFRSVGIVIDHLLYCGDTAHLMLLDKP